MDEPWTTAGPGLPDEQEPGSGGGAPARDRVREARLVATGVALTLLLWFAFANLQRVPIHFWLVSASAPLIVVIVVSGFLGAAVSALWSWSARRRKRGGTAP